MSTSHPTSSLPTSSFAECPRCGHVPPPAATDCPACGVILAKARQRGVPDPDGLSYAIQIDGAIDEEPKTFAERAARVLLREERADPVTLVGRGVLLVLLLFWTWSLGTASIASNAVGESFLHLINLPFHEAGHILFMPFGGFMMSLGGSLTQVLVPLLLAIVFLTKHRDPFGAAATWWWTGENLLDLAPYIDDARNLQLVLLGGKTGAEVEGHDWERILMSLGWLHLDHTLARLAHAAGVIVMLTALVWGVAVVAAHWQRSQMTSHAGGSAG